MGAVNDAQLHRTHPNGALRHRCGCELLERSARGLSFPTHVHIAALPELGRLPPADRTLGLLNVLFLLSQSDGARQLASEHHNPALDRVACERIHTVVEVLHAEHAQPITLKTVADTVHMAPAALSRFFRRITRTTITGYLNTLRVNAAYRMLVDTNLPIAHVAAGCGYQNLSPLQPPISDTKRDVAT